MGRATEFYDYIRTPSHKVASREKDIYCSLRIGTEEKLAKKNYYKDLKGVKDGH